MQVDQVSAASAAAAASPAAVLENLISEWVQAQNGAKSGSRHMRETKAEIEQKIVQYMRSAGHDYYYVPGLGKYLVLEESKKSVTLNMDNVTKLLYHFLVRSNPQLDRTQLEQMSFAFRSYCEEKIAEATESGGWHVKVKSKPPGLAVVRGALEMDDINPLMRPRTAQHPSAGPGPAGGAGGWGGGQQQPPPGGSSFSYAVPQ